MKNKKVNSFGSAHVCAIGEHYVMARLLANEFLVGIPPTNTKIVDFIAVSQDGKKSVQIQVKTRTEGRSKDWPMWEKHEQILQPNLYYVFVSLPEKWADDNQPETFVIPSNKVAQILKQSHGDWHTTPGAKGQQRNNTKMRRIRPKYPDSPSIPENWMEEFRDNWQLLSE